MTSKFETIILGSAGRPMLADIQLVRDARRKPVIVFCHGFKGFKSWGHFDAIAGYFAKNGFVFVKFNFSHNGTTPEKPMEFSDLEAFGNNNYLFELDDLGIVINAVEKMKELEGEADGKIYLLGHSRGGAISIIKASEDKRVKKIATWAAVSDLVNRNKKNTIQHWENDGVVYTKNARTGQEMPLYYQFYQTIIQNKERLNVAAAATRLTIPFLVIHGTRDEAVKLSDARQLHNSCAHSRLVEIEGAGHTFGATHPCTQSEFAPHLLLALENTLAFLKEGS